MGRWSDKNDIVEFKKDGTFTASYYWIGGSYTTKGNTITLSPTLLSLENYTYEIKKQGANT